MVNNSYHSSSYTFDASRYAIYDSYIRIYFLKEKVSNTTFTAIIIAAIGIGFMAFTSRHIGTLFGLLAIGLLSSFGFSIFSVSLRWKKNTPTFTTVAVAGLFCATFSFACFNF